MKTQRPTKAQRPNMTQHPNKTQRPMKTQHPLTTPRLRTLVGAITTVGVAVSLLTASPATAQTLATTQTLAARAADDSTGFAVPPASVPVVDSQMGVGVQAAPEPADIDVVRDDSSPRSALVRITALEPAAATDVSAAGALALRLGPGATASTTVLVPLAADGTFALAATTPVDTRVEPVAYFGDAAAPGSVTSLPESVVRTEEGGDALSPAGTIVGLTGLGGVPSTGVRSVFVTTAFASTGDTAGEAPRTVSLDGIDIPVEDGTVVSTFITPSVDGDTLITGPADVSVTLTVRGWVAEAAQSESADPANVTGSVLPAIGAETVETELVENEPTAVGRGDLPADSHALALVWADAATIVTAISAGSAATGRTTGAVVDAGRGAAPQLLLLDPDDSALRVSGGDVDAHSRVVASIVGAELPRAADLDISVTSPSSGATVDLGETGGTVALSGDITVEGGDLAAVEVKQGDTTLGSPELRYDSTGITWAFETAAPESGTYDFTITATDRSGAQDSATVRVTITLPATSETVIVDNVQILDDPTTVTVTELTDDTVVVVCDLEVGPGDFIVAGSVPGAPEGFLRRIRAVDITDAGAVLHTEAAMLTDVIIQANVDEEHDLGEGGGTVVEEAAPDPEMITLEGDEPTAWTQEGAVDTTGFTELTEEGATGAASRAPAPPSDLVRPFGVGVETGVEASSSVKIGLELSKDLGPATDASKADGAATKKSQQVKGGFYVEASASASVKLGVDVEVWVTWSWAIPTPHIDFETAFTMSAKLKATVAAYLKASASTQKNAFKKEVAKYHFPGITVYLGIPVWVTPKVSLGVTGEVSASASVEYTLEQSATKKIGVSCEDGVCSKIDDTPKGADGSQDLDAVKDVFTGGGKLEASVGPEFSASALLYGFAGPEISLSFKLGGAATIEGSSDKPKVSGSIDIFLKVSAGLDLVVEIPIFEIVLIEWSLGEKFERKFTLFTWPFEFDLSEPSDPPSEDSGSSGTKPTPGTGGDGDGTRDSIDVMFVIDTTGSMSGIIQATLDKARDIATRMNASARSARIGLVEYRDYGDEFMARTVQPLTEDLTAFGTALDTLYASGGGDWEEAVYSGIVTALAEDWRPSAARTVIVMGDAPAHDPDVHTGYTASQVAGFLSGDALCRNGDSDIIGGPTLPACGPMDGASFSAPASPHSSASARLAPSENATGGLPVILFGISSDWSGTLTEQLQPLAEGSGGTVAGIDGADAVGDAIDAALEAAGAAPQPYFEWEPGDDANTVAFDGTGSVFEGESATFSYDFGDGSDAVTGAAATTHTFAAPGTYDVTLTVTDEKGRSAQVVASVSVVDDTEPEWGVLAVAPDRGDAQAGESVTFTAAGLEPGGRVSVAWDGTVGAAMGVVGDDGVVSITLAVPAGAAAGELGYTMKALDEHRVGGGVITVTPTVAVCAA